jgi:hypothetical protein
MSLENMFETFPRRRNIPRNDSSFTNPVSKFIDNLQHTEIQQDNLPHLYSLPWYEWAWDFLVSPKRINFLNAANQVSKSSTEISKTVLFATEPKLWDHLWPNRTKKVPTPFWYWYPSTKIATEEFENKWMDERLPLNEMKDDPQYGWKVKYLYGQVYYIRFNTGVTVYFRSYEQHPKNVQGSSIFYNACDEEMPESFYDEIWQRMSSPSVDGIFDMVFTATLGQKFWYDTMELMGKPGERFKNAFKQQVSKWECLKYRDGSASPWTVERIKQQIIDCRNEAEVRKRILGRFAKAENLLFNAYDSKRNTIAKVPEKTELHYYAAVYVCDKTGKAAISILGVNSEYSRCYLVDSHWFDSVDTTSFQIFSKLMDRVGKKRFSGLYANKHASDFMKVADASKYGFVEVKKPNDNAAKLINSLLSDGLIQIVDTERNSDAKYHIAHCDKKAEDLEEYETLGALILIASNVPWDFEKILKLVKPPKKEKELDPRMKFWLGLDRPELKTSDTTEQELLEANEDYEFYGYETGF